MQGIRIHGTDYSVLNDKSLNRSDSQVNCVFLRYAHLSSLLVAFDKLHVLKTIKHVTCCSNDIDSLIDIEKLVHALPKSISSLKLEDNAVTNLQLFR